MRVYHERLRVPTSWWLLGMAVAIILATEVVAGFGWLVAIGIYVVIVGVIAAMLVSWGRAAVDIVSVAGDGANPAGAELRAGGKPLPLAAAGEVAALDEAQTRAMRGPRADPAAYLLLRPYLRTSVYVEVKPAAQSATQSATQPQADEGEAGGGEREPRPPVGTGGREQSAGHVPYWLIGTRKAEELAAAIDSARSATRADGPRVG
jgi:hypothetical protein